MEEEVAALRRAADAERAARQEAEAELARQRAAADASAAAEAHAGGEAVEALRQEARSRPMQAAVG
jgi:hypothetical protein